MSSNTAEALSSRLLQAALESSPNGAVLVDANGEILYVNRETERIFGYDSGELIGQAVEVLVPETFRDRHPEQRAAYLSNPARRAMGAGRDLLGRRKDGSEFPIEIGLNPVEHETGVGVIASVADISERRQVEAALRRQRDTTRALVSAALAIVVVITAGALGISRLQAINDDLGQVSSHNLPLALEISNVHALQLEQDGLFERALRFAEQRLGTNRTDSPTPTQPASGSGSIARLTDAQYRRAIEEYERVDQDVLEHIRDARELVSAALSDPARLTDTRQLEAMRRSLVAIETLHRNSSERARAVIQLLDAGQAVTALELAAEVGFQDKEIEELVSEILAEVQISTDAAVADARAIYRRALYAVAILSGIAILGLLVAALLGLPARLRHAAR